MALEQRKQRSPWKTDKKPQPGSAAHAVAIPDKLYFRIGEVAQLCGLPPHVLRFWETEFPQLKPNKGGNGQRLYRKQDVELVLELQQLLHREKFTIAGARRLLAEKRHGSSVHTAHATERTLAPQPIAPDLQTMRGELRAILGLLDGEIVPARVPLREPTAGRTGEVHAKKQPVSKRGRSWNDDNAPLLF